MKITTSQVTKHLLTELDGLDPISVICENLGPGRGKITITCFDDCWSHFWSHMGEQYTLETFFLKANDDYIAGKLCSGRQDEPDWDGMPDRIRKEIVKLRRAGDLEKTVAREYYNDASSIDHEVAAHFNSQLLSSVFGDDWMCCIPDRPTREYRHLSKIIPVVKEAFRNIAKPADNKRPIDPDEALYQEITGGRR